MKRLMAAGVAAIVAIGLSITADATCHDTYDCEDVTTSVAGHYRWPPGNSNVWYYINPTHEKGADDPDMTADVKAAAAKWNYIVFGQKNGQDNTIPFGVRFKDTTSSHRADNIGDGKNTVGWHCLGQPEDEADLGWYRRRVNLSTGYIIECDIMINPYYDWDLHGNTSSSEHCLLNTLTHEFGHLAGLEDVEYNPNNQSGEGNCPAWVDYTMHTGASANEHDQEDLACEDKYALAYVYDALPDDDD